jgi:hypothetical protein
MIHGRNSLIRGTTRVGKNSHLAADKSPDVMAKENCNILPQILEEKYTTRRFFSVKRDFAVAIEWGALAVLQYNHAESKSQPDGIVLLLSQKTSTSLQSRPLRLAAQHPELGWG